MAATRTRGITIDTAGLRTPTHLVFGRLAQTIVHLAPMPVTLVK